MSCTCEGSTFLDSMCVSCLTNAEQHLIPKVEKIREELDDLESQLEWVRWYKDNPRVEG